MAAHGETEIKQMLGRLNAGERGAAEALFPLIYDELRVLAQGQFRHERKEHTLQATALVHEAYMRLVHSPSSSWQDRAHFFGIAARVMRQVLVDHARRKNAKKRSAEFEHVTLERIAAFPEGEPLDILKLDQAMDRLSKLDARKALVVELRLFADMKMDEVAEVLSVSKRTVEADWFFARAWLEGELA